MKAILTDEQIRLLDLSEQQRIVAGTLESSVLRLALAHIRELTNLRYLDIRGIRWNNITCSPNLETLVVNDNQMNCIRFWSEAPPEEVSSLKFIIVEGRAQAVMEDIHFRNTPITVREYRGIDSNALEG